MNQPSKERIAKLNKCDPDQVRCDNCYFLDGNLPFCHYHKQSLLFKDEACYKFKKRVR